jgi:hypothetical protein
MPKRAAGNQVVDIQVLFPLPEENFNVPAKLIGKGLFFCA